MSDQDLEIIYNQNFRKLYRFFYYKVLSREIAEDLTSDTFISFVEILQNKTHGEVKDPVKYLYGIAKLTLLKFLREKYNSIQSIPIESENDFGGYVDSYLEDIDNSPTPEDFAIKYINELPEKQRLVLTLRLIDKNSLAEICKILDKDMNYVKTTQKRGLKNLKLLFAAGQCTPD